jgi:hypothetical protein
MKSHGRSERQFIAVVVFRCYIYTIKCSPSHFGPRGGRWAERENGEGERVGKYSRKVGGKENSRKM